MALIAAHLKAGDTDSGGDSVYATIPHPTPHPPYGPRPPPFSPSLIRLIMVSVDLTEAPCLLTYLLTSSVTYLLLVSAVLVAVGQLSLPSGAAL